MRSTLTIQFTPNIRSELAVRPQLRARRGRAARASLCAGYDAPRGWLDRLMFWMIG